MYDGALGARGIHELRSYINQGTLFEARTAFSCIKLVDAAPGPIYRMTSIRFKNGNSSDGGSMQFIVEGRARIWQQLLDGKFFWRGRVMREQA